MEAAHFPQPWAFVCWTVARLREKDDDGKQLILQVLRQLEDDLDQMDPAVLKEQKTAGAKIKNIHSSRSSKAALVSIQLHRKDFWSSPSSSGTTWLQVQIVVHDNFSARSPRNPGPSRVFLK